jgi:AcrR family transcriptional regulator
MAAERLDTETRQEQIKKAVLEIISTEGIGKLSTRNLASKIGVTEGALFRHFSSKKEIMLSILDDVKNELLADQEKITFSSDLSAEEKLFKFLCLPIAETISLFTEVSFSWLYNSINLFISFRSIWILATRHF